MGMPAGAINHDHVWRAAVEAVERAFHLACGGDIGTLRPACFGTRGQRLQLAALQQDVFREPHQHTLAFFEQRATFWLEVARVNQR